MSAQTHVFAIAVENYQVPTINPVAFAENDATKFIEVWQQLGVEPGNCTTLLSAHATKTTIESTLKKFISNAEKDDTVVFFYAGHGTAYDDVSYITTRDTQPGDIEATSISLSTILETIKAGRSSRAMLFIDACKSGLPITDGMRSITSDFTAEELVAFCNDAEHHVGFSACKVNEKSVSNTTLQHGIWTYSVLRALSGEAKEALEKGRIVTSDSLRDFLSIEVPRLHRRTVTGTGTQTPCFFGNATKQFIVADLTRVLAERAAKANALGNALKGASIRGIEYGSVKSLSGFKKGNFAPDRHNSSAQSFITNAGKEEIESQSKEILAELRYSFGYKKKELDYESDYGAASIKTPDFDVDISLCQDPEDASGYILTTEVGMIRNPEVVGEDRFSQVFSRYCNTLVFHLSQQIDVEAKIEEIENVPELEKHLKYDLTDCSWFTLKIPDQGIEVSATEDEITLSLTGRGDIKALLEKTENAVATLSGSGVTLMLI